ncbi:MAG: EAL domain-containing protein [Aeromonas sp.]
MKSYSPSTSNSSVKLVFRSYLHDISAIALLLLPLTLVNALSILIGQGLTNAGYPDLAGLMFRLSNILINLYPLALCIITSYYLSHRSTINTGTFIVYALALFYTLSHAHNSFSAPFNLPNSTMLALLCPVLTLAYCQRIPLRELAPHTLDFSLTLLLHVARFFCFGLLMLALSVISPYLMGLLLTALSQYQPDPLTWSGGLVYQATLGILGAIGINGHNFLLPVKQMLYQATTENLADWQAGLAPLNTISQGFYDAFLSMGGSGNSISLLLCVLFFSRNRNHTMLALTAMPMVLFNINEVLLFGLPIIFNPLLIIPFIGVPLVSFAVAYLAISYELVSPIVTTVDWMTPPLLSGYLAMGNKLEGSMLQLLIILVGILIYRPFYLAFAGTGLDQAERSGKVERLTLHKMLADIKASALRSQQRAEAQLRVETILRQGKLVMFYQVQSSVSSVKSMEALVRYQDKAGSLKGPTFIADFQQLDAMPLLDYLVIDLVMTDMQQMPLQQVGRVAINISAATIKQPDFIDHLTTRMAHYGIAPDKLELEITEEALLDDKAQLRDTMTALQARGIHIAMDDFGAGFASFPHLMKYPFDKVKLDRSLLLDCTDDKGRQLYGLLVQVGTLANCRVLAEGVETEQEREFVNACGVDGIQGYLIARPAPLDQVLQHLNDPASAA